MGNMFGRGFESHQLHKPACGETAEQQNAWQAGLLDAPTGSILLIPPAPPSPAEALAKAGFFIYLGTSCISGL